MRVSPGFHLLRLHEEKTTRTQAKCIGLFLTFAPVDSGKMSATQVHLVSVAMEFNEAVGLSALGAINLYIRQTKLQEHQVFRLNH